MGERESLEHAVYWLKEYGLEIEESLTFIQDESTQSTLVQHSHLEAYVAALSAIRYAGDPNLKAIRVTLQSLARRFPHEDLKSHVNTAVLSRVVYRYIRYLKSDEFKVKNDLKAGLGWEIYNRLRWIEVSGPAVLMEGLKVAGASAEDFRSFVEAAIDYDAQRTRENREMDLKYSSTEDYQVLRDSFEELQRRLPTRKKPGTLDLKSFWSYFDVWALKSIGREASLLEVLIEVDLIRDSVSLYGDRGLGFLVESLVKQGIPPQRLKAALEKFMSEAL